MEQYRSSHTKRRVGLMGGTFDPVHYGHLVVAEEVRATCKLDDMVFIPAGEPPHKQGGIVTAAHHRLAMLELAIASNPHFSISLVDMDRPGPSYTVETLHMLYQQWGQHTELYFVIGWDSLQEFHTWHDPARILEQLTCLVAVHRPGYTAERDFLAQSEARLPTLKQHLLTMPAPQLEISATDLRQRIAEGRPVKYQIPEAVEHYIVQHKLYQ
ncbi:MAG: nicotinate-nucleotide adenylyltransferase [Ktedonobacteraceae bacterium]